MKRRDGTLEALYDHWILGKHCREADAEMVGRP